MSDLGGEPACWAHLEDELDTRPDTDRVAHVDVTRLGGDGSDALWRLPHDGDLDAGLDADVVRLPGGEEIGSDDADPRSSPA